MFGRGCANGGGTLADQGEAKDVEPAKVAGFLKELPACVPAAAPCAVHQDTPSVAVCTVCAKPLCRVCAPVSEVEPTCAGCRHPLKGRWQRVRSLLAPSLPSLWLLVGLSLIAYVVLTAQRFNAFKEEDISDRGQLTKRCRLQATKAARSNYYAEILEKEERHDLARRRYRMALEATERVLADFPETEYYQDLKGDERPYTETRLRLALVKFLIRTGELDRAREELDRLLEENPGGDSALLARFRLGEVLETTAPHEAIREYRACQPEAGAGFGGLGFLDRIIDAASLNPSARKFFLETTKMAGTFDPAEAQARIIACHEKLGERLQAEVAYNKLVKEYPFSAQAKRLQEERGDPATPKNPRPPLPFLKNQPWLKNQPLTKNRPAGGRQPDEEEPEETLTVVPLE